MRACIFSFLIVFATGTIYAARTPAEIIVRADEELKRVPGSFAARLNRGYGYYRLNKMDRALEDFRKAYLSAENPQQKSIVRYNMGNALFLQSRLKDALEQYRLGLRLNPQDRDLVYNYTVTKMLLDQQQNQKKKNDRKQDKQNRQQKQQNKQKDENKKNEPQKQNKTDKRKAPQPQRPMTKADVKRLLKTMHEREKKQMNRPQMIIRGAKNEKDW